MSGRGNPYPHRYKYGVIKNPINLEVWLKFLGRLEVVDRHGYSVEFLEAVHAVFYWTGFRKSEVLGRKTIRYKVMHKECKGKGCERCMGGKVWKLGPAHPGLLKEDVQLRLQDDGRYLLVYSVGDKVLKHGSREEPVWLHESLPKCDRIFDVWEKTKPEHKLFPIRYITFWRICKSMDPKFTMHFYRHNRLDELSQDPEMSLKDIMGLSGLSAKTVSEYMLRAGRSSKKVGKRLKQKYGK